MSIDAIKPEPIALIIYIVVIYSRVSHAVATIPFSNHANAVRFAVSTARNRIVDSKNEGQELYEKLWEMSENMANYEQFLREYNIVMAHAAIHIKPYTLPI